MTFDLEKKIDELQELVSKYDTESFAGFFAYFIKKRPDPFAKIDLNKFESKLKDFLYLIALNVFSEKKGNETFELPTATLATLADKLNAIKDFNRGKKLLDYTKESVIHEMAFRNHFDNGVLSYVEQDLERIRTIFAPFEEKIIQDFEFDINFLIEICKEIELISMIRFKYLTEFFHTKEFADFTEKVQSKKATFSDAFQLLPADIQDKFLAFDSKNYSCLIFTAEDLYGRLEHEKVDRFLLMFSRQSLFDPAIRYYSAESPFELTPLLKFPEKKYYLSLYGKQIPISIYKKLFAHLFNDKTTQQKLLRHREKSLEKKVIALFKYFFTSREAFFYENYYIEAGHEQDLLTIYKGNAIIIEVKASKLREPFRNVEKAIQRLKGDFEDSIQYGFNQCKRVEDYFFDSSLVEIKDGKGKVLYTVNPSKIHSVYSIVVTLERFGSLQTDLKLMLEKEDDVDYPWSVYIDDLEVFLLALKQNVSSPVTRFLDFLKLRRKIHGRLYAIDELDICATFIQNPEKFKEYTNMTDTGLTFSPYGQEAFDKLYSVNQLRFKEKPLPDEFYKFGI